MEFEMELEVSAAEGAAPFPATIAAESGDVQKRLLIQIKPEAGYGFGVVELLTLIVDIGVGVSSDFASDAIRSGIKRVIRRCKVGDDMCDGSQDEIAGLIDRVREAEGEALEGDI
jgi:hypothetical protein